MLDDSLIKDLVREALLEDLGPGDWTTDAIISADSVSKGVMIAKAAGVIAGLPLAKAAFSFFDPGVLFSPVVTEGGQAAPGEVIAEISGSTRAILKGERTALNFLQHLSGIATVTARYVEAVKGLPVRIVDTRKTLPGLRSVEKYAVRAGGGTNHRMGLFDAILIKDNHLQAAGGVKAAVARVRGMAPFTVKVEIEAENLQQVEDALAAGVDIIMLDNMTTDKMREAVMMIDHRALAEASGGITLERVQEIAATGVDVISVGALTHSVMALDISLKLI